MSTKLYDAYKLKAPIQDVFKLSKKIRKSFNLALQKKYQADVLLLCLEIYDWLTYFKTTTVYCKNINKSENVSLFRLVHELLIHDEAQYRAANKLPTYYAHANLYEYNNELFATVRSRDHQFQDVFKKITAAQDFGYWNNTDQPDGISRKNWKNREVIWNRVFGNSEWDIDNAQNALKVQCEIQIFKYEIFARFKHAPPISSLLGNPQRGCQIARHLTDSEFDFTNLKTHEIMQMISSKEYKIKLSKNLKKVQRRLSQEVSYEQLVALKASLREKRVHENDYPYFSVMI